MKFLKITGLFILGIVVLVLIAALLVNKKYAVEREITIKQPVSKVFNYVKLLKNQDNFSVWNQMDPTMKKTFTGIDGTVGAVAGWESENKEVGKGEQEIVSVNSNKKINFEMRFYEPQEATGHAYFITDSLGDSLTLVKWGFYGKMSYPMNLMLVFMDMDTMLGPQLKTSLQNLKVILEKPEKR